MVVLALAASLAFVALNAFFVAAEFAIVKVRVTQLERTRASGRRIEAARKVLERLDRYLSVTQLGITVASLGLGWIGEPAIEHVAQQMAAAVGLTLGRAGSALVGVASLGLLTFVHMLLGEQVPKFIALQHAPATVLSSAIPLRIVSVVFRPLLWVIETVQRAILKVIGIDPDVASEGKLSEDEIVGILAAQRGGKERDKERIVERVLRFAHRPVRHLMVPRVDVVWLPIETSGARALEVIREHEFSRFPVAGESLDEVIGYVYAKELLLDPDAEDRATLRGLERHALLVPESRDSLAVLRDMQRAAVPFAIVIDEYGGTSGIVTVEDMIEGVLGDIRDELDVEPRRVVRVSGRAKEWDVDVTATTDELRDAGIPIDEDSFGESVGRLVVERIGHMPKVGDVAELACGVLVEVTAMTRRRIRKLRVSVQDEAPSTP